MRVISTGEAARVYAGYLGIPLIILVLAGLFAPLWRPLFVVVTVVVLLYLCVVLLFHESIFCRQAGSRDPLPRRALSPYLASSFALGSVFLLIGANARNLGTFIDWVEISRTVLSPQAAEAHDHELTLSTSGLAEFGEWILFVTFIGLYAIWMLGIPLFTASRRNLWLGRAVAAVASVCFCAALIWFLLGMLELDELVGDKILFVMYLVIIMVSGLSILSMLYVFLNIRKDLILSIDDHGTSVIGIPTAFVATDLVTMVQGFNGVLEHYLFLAPLALAGMLVTGLSMFGALAFIGIALVYGIKERNVAHYLLAFVGATSFGCVALFGLIEIGRAFYSYFIPSELG